MSEAGMHSQTNWTTWNSIGIKRRFAPAIEWNCGDPSLQSRVMRDISGVKSRISRLMKWIASQCQHGSLVSFLVVGHIRLIEGLCVFREHDSAIHW